jgi:hypothetical protein
LWLSGNSPNIWDHYSNENPDKPYSVGLLSRNPNIAEFIPMKNPDKWDWRKLSINEVFTGSIVSSKPNNLGIGACFMVILIH